MGRALAWFALIAAISLILGIAAGHIEVQNTRVAERAIAPVEHVLATDAVAVDIDTQGIGIQWNDRRGDAPLATRRPSSGTLITVCGATNRALLTSLE